MINKLVLVRWTYNWCWALQFLQQKAIQFHSKKKQCRSFSKLDLCCFLENQMQKPLKQHNYRANGSWQPPILWQQLLQKLEAESRSFPIWCCTFNQQWSYQYCRWAAWLSRFFHGVWSIDEEDGSHSSAYRKFGRD